MSPAKGWRCRPAARCLAARRQECRPGIRETRTRRWPVEGRRKSRDTGCEEWFPRAFLESQRAGFEWRLENVDKQNVSRHDDSDAVDGGRQEPAAFNDREQ